VRTEEIRDRITVELGDRSGRASNPPAAPGDRVPQFLDAINRAVPTDLAVHVALRETALDGRQPANGGPPGGARRTGGEAEPLRLLTTDDRHGCTRRVRSASGPARTARWLKGQAIRLGTYLEGRKLESTHGDQRRR
jgi:hypothetical protein